ncbi:hypothetical protein MJL30_38755, partial [Salmonella enterica subsp. enterica serovar Anatum]|nr:hypothetical protein [Salmonella enterica subsp. enterica serovar Anatum]
EAPLENSRISKLLVVANRYAGAEQVTVAINIIQTFHRRPVFVYECSGGSPVSLSLADSELFNKASCCHNLPDADKAA